MQKRNTQHRRQLIIDSLKTVGELSVEALAKEHVTSEVTIRKDLASLEEAGLLMRRYGGAVAIPKEALDEKDKNLSKRKISIAKRAASLIKDHYRIVIDSGSTTRALLPFLSEVRGLVVMTNSIAVAQALQALENEPTILMTGGTWDKRSESFQGRLAQLMLKEYNFDQLFIGADGLDPERGTTTYNEFTDLSQAMADSASEVIVLAESSKLYRKIPNLEIPWSDIDYLVTDNQTGEDPIKIIEKNNVKVLIANPNSHSNG